jgi:hypothetical protein
MMGAPGTTNGMLNGPIEQPVPERNRTVVQPPALPGARTTAEPAPMDRPPSDLRPNEALFDAINRGDIATARDALARGADLHATNVLGLTPTELSVDLGRNDITFLLLSLRGATGGGPRRPTPVPAAPVAAQAAPARPAPRPVAVAAAPRPAPAPAPAPQQYANVPSTPVPQAGFLGFGGTGH